jgi:hypothetical protein
MLSVERKIETPEVYLLDSARDYFQPSQKARRSRLIRVLNPKTTPDQLQLRLNWMKLRKSSLAI